MPSCVSSDTRIVLFADDAKLYRTISSTDEQAELPNDLNALYNWSKIWEIDFNAKKCVVLQVKNRKRHHVRDPHLVGLRACSGLPFCTTHRILILLCDKGNKLN